jgi:hypothetical protein
MTKGCNVEKNPELSCGKISYQFSNGILVLPLAFFEGLNSSPHRPIRLPSAIFDSKTSFFIFLERPSRAFWKVFLYNLDESLMSDTKALLEALDKFLKEHPDIQTEEDLEDALQQGMSETSEPSKKPKSPFDKSERFFALAMGELDDQKRLALLDRSLKANPHNHDAKKEYFIETSASEEDYLAKLEAYEKEELDRYKKNGFAASHIGNFYDLKETASFIRLLDAVAYDHYRKGDYRIASIYAEEERLLDSEDHCQAFRYLGKCYLALDEPKKFIAFSDAEIDKSVFHFADSALFFIKYGDFARAYEILRKETLASNPWVADFLSFGNSEEIKSAPSEDTGNDYQPGSIDEAYAYCEELPLDDIISDDTFSAFLIYASQRYLKDLSPTPEEVTILAGLAEMVKIQGIIDISLAEIKAFFLKKDHGNEDKYAKSSMHGILEGQSERSLVATIHSLVEEGYVIKSKEKKYALSHEGKNIVYALRFFNAKPAKTAKA